MCLFSLYQRKREEFRRILRYLAIGGWNTVFGLGVYALLYRLFGRDVNYLVLAIPANILAITNAFFCYKLLVFRTRGNYWREYFRCYIVYGGGALLSTGLLWAMVKFFRIVPDLANVFATGIVFVASYFGHKLFSFRGRFPELENKRIFVTGGTGFFGKSLLSYLKRNPIPWLKLVVLTRDPEKFCARNPEFADLPFAEFVAGDVRNFVQKDSSFDYVIHAATTSGGPVSDEEMHSVICDGTKQTLAFAAGCPRLKRLLYVSSGAVYGVQEPELPQMDEAHACNPVTVYGKSKLAAEKMCAASGISFVTARCFAFVGPYLPRTAHFAIGNFMEDCLNAREIVIKGDGTPYRTYLYADDLAEWLLTVMTRGKAGEAYNVGSPEAVSIADLASTVRGVLGGASGVRILTPPDGTPVSRYVPDVAKAYGLGLLVRIGLAEAIRKSAETR